MNNFNGIGRLVRDAELKYTGAGIPCVNFSICIDKIWKDKNGARQEKPNFFNCIIWGKYGEVMNKYLTKGKQIGITAELEQNTWQDAQGNNHSRVQLSVNEIFLLSSPNKGGAKGNNADEPPPKNGEPDVIPF